MDGESRTTVNIRNSTKDRIDYVASMYSLPRTVSYDVILNYILDKASDDKDIESDLKIEVIE